MADIEQVAGELNISRMYQGESMSLTTYHTGDLTGDTFTASVENGATDLELAITKTYSSVTLKTSVVIALSMIQSALLTVGVHQWKLTQKHGSDVRIIVRGNWGVYQS